MQTQWPKLIGIYWGMTAVIPFVDKMKGLAVVVAVMSLALAQPPRMPKGLPPGFKEALPADVVQKLEQIHENTSLTPEQQFDQIDKIMSALPASVLAKLPPPPFLSQLPADARAKVEAVHRDTTLSWKQRHEKIRAIIEALPENLRPRPPGGPHGPPPPGGKQILESEKTFLRKNKAYA
ncbi:unnamed protein product [Haemonchus placei]|uniref:LTXXQ motif family protein n=1 Tax=Haemonchus placei TaxID=6290 RepID=A0A0N4XAN7_HAEPC|nr:unnamed protein product [Haemonchus placei]